MEFIKLKLSLLLIILVTVKASVFAQEKRAGKKMKEALDERMEADANFAKYQQAKFNKEEWKHSWEGVKLSELFKKWGAPTRSFDDGSGGQVVVYETVSYSSGGTYTPGYSITESLTTVSGTVLQSNTATVAAKDTRWVRQNIRSTNVFVNKEGVITKITETYN
jgi:hypothetical protein